MIQTKKIILSGLLIALGVLIPIFFHMLGAGGPVFLPMHLPVMVTGFLVGPLFGLIVGALTPFISSLLTGMPPLFPMAVLMIFELSAYGFICGFLYEKRTAINNLHKDAGDEVKKDLLPPMSDIADMMEKSGLRVVDKIDNDEMFLIIGQK